MSDFRSVRTDFMFVLPDDTAVVVFTMGAPEKSHQIEPFLYELLCDPAVVNLPLGFLYQKQFARRIARKRSALVEPRYSAIGGSPLAANTRKQCSALSRLLGATVEPVYRYIEPKAETVLGKLKEKGIRNIVAVSLYPQESGTTVGTSMADLEKAAETHGLNVAFVRDYPEHPGFIEGLAMKWAETVDVPEVDLEHATVLFTAHGIPQSYVRRGDEYPYRVEATMQAIRARLPEIKQGSLAWQSRFGPTQWTQPYLDDEIRRLGKEGVKTLVLFPISFVSEHLETIYDLDLVATDLAVESGIETVLRVSTVGDDPFYIEALAAMVVETASRVFLRK